jgi:hypothetical protein
MEPEVSLWKEGRLKVGQIRKTNDWTFEETLFIIVQINPTYIRYLGSGKTVLKMGLDIVRNSEVIGG